MGLLKIKNNGSWLAVISDYAARALVTAHNLASNAHQSLFDAKADASDLTSHTNNTSNPHSVTKTQVGLGNVDNTSDASKPISAATQAALDTKIETESSTLSTAMPIDADTLEGHASSYFAASLSTYTKTETDNTFVKQTENSLTTTSKLVVGAINELDANAKTLGLSVVNGAVNITYEEE